MGDDHVFVLVGFACFVQFTLIALVFLWICAKEGPCAKVKNQARNTLQRQPRNTTERQTLTTAEDQTPTAYTAENVPETEVIEEREVFLVSSWVSAIRERIHRLRGNSVNQNQEEIPNSLPSDQSEIPDGLPSYQDALPMQLHCLPDSYDKVPEEPPPSYEDLSNIHVVPSN